MLWRRIIILLAEWWSIPTGVGCLNCALCRQLTLLFLHVVTFFPLLKCTGQISFFIPNSTNQQKWCHMVTLEKVKWRGNIKQIRGVMCVLCNVTSVRKPLISNRCVLRISAVNYMCKLWSDFTPTLLDQILYVTSTHKCHIDTISFSTVMELWTLHVMLNMYTGNQAWVLINSHTSADMQFGTWMNSFLTCGLDVVVRGIHCEGYCIS